MSELAMAYLTLGDIDPFELVEAAARGGFKSTAIRLTGHAPGDNWGFNPREPNQRHRMRTLADVAGIALVNASTYRFVPGVSVEDYDPVLETCAELGIGTITANSFAGERAEVAALMQAVAERAALLGIRIAIEFIPVSKVRTAEDALALVLATGSDNVGILVDALHLWRSGGSVRTIEDLPSDRLFAVQLCDGPANAPQPDQLAMEMRKGRLLPGAGEFDLRGLMQALPAGIEVEIEAPNARFDSLTPADKARLVHNAARSFLETLEAS